MTTHRQLILSGGIHHAFNQTSLTLAPLGEQHGLATSIVVHPDDAFEALEEASVQLFVVNALFWEMEGPNMMSSERIGSCVSREQAACLDRFVARGGKPRPAHCEHLFLNLPHGAAIWRALAVARIVSSPNRALSVNPTPTGEALGLTAFDIEDELYTRFIGNQISPLMTARDVMVPKKWWSGEKNMARLEVPTLR